MKPFRGLMSCLTVPALAIMAGCATPKPVLDLAGQGAATTGLAEIALRDYLRMANFQIATRTALVRADAMADIRVRNRQEMDSFVAKEAGDPEGNGTVDFIRKIGRERQNLRDVGEAKLAEAEKKFSADVLQTAQVPTERLAKTKEAFSVLSQELTTKEWMSLASSYAKEIRKDAKALKSGLDGDKPD